MKLRLLRLKSALAPEIRVCSGPGLGEKGGSLYFNKRNQGFGSGPALGPKALQGLSTERNAFAAVDIAASQQSTILQVLGGGLTLISRGGD